jgi:hypothetical protein
MKAMNTCSKFALGVAMLFGCHMAIAAGGSYASHDSISSGSGAAAAGTNLYNSTMKPKTPLPVHGGDGAVVHQTIRNMGRGQNPKKAWSNAAMSESGAGAARSSTKSRKPRQ